MRSNFVLVLLAVATFVVLGSTANATTFMSDSFSYADGDLTKYDGTGDNVSGGAWRPHSGTGFPTSVVVSSGQAVLKNGNPASEDVNRKAIYGGQQNNGLGETWYYAALVTVNDERALNDPNNPLNNDYFMHFKDAGNGYRGRAYIDDPSTGAGGAGFTFGLSTTSGGQAVAWGSDLSFGQQYKIMVSYTTTIDPNSVGQAEVEMWVDPVSIASPSITHSDPAGALTLLAGLAMRQDFTGGSSGPNNEVLVDAVALGNDFDSVMMNVMNGSNVPEPTSVALALLGLIGVGCSRRRN